MSLPKAAGPGSNLCKSDTKIETSGRGIGAMRKPFNWICSCKPYVATYHGRWGPEKWMLVHNVDCTKSRFSRMTMVVRIPRELSGRRAVETTDLPQSGSGRRPLSIGRTCA